MVKILRYALQVFNYFIFITIVWYFSAAPAYQHIAPDKAVIALAFGHSSQLVEECRRLSPEELAELSPNMRTPMVCPRQRSPIEVELVLDEELLLRETFQPPGLSGDWGVDVYRQFKVPSGSHHLKIRLKDSVRVEDFNYTHEEEVVLKPAQMLVVDFQPNEGGFIIN